MHAQSATQKRAAFDQIYEKVPAEQVISGPRKTSPCISLSGKWTRPLLPSARIPALARQPQFTPEDLKGWPGKVLIIEPEPNRKAQTIRANTDYR